MHFKRILTEAHLDGISSMDVCLRRSIMVSASARDKSVRVWSLRSNKCEVHNEFLDSPLCVSLHPSGWMLCAGFSDKLRIMNILNNDFHVIKEISLKACRVCEFSRGGHLVATFGRDDLHSSRLHVRSRRGAQRSLWKSQVAHVERSRFVPHLVRHGRRHL